MVTDADRCHISWNRIWPDNKQMKSLEKKSWFLDVKICFPSSRDIKGPTRAWKLFAEEAVGLDLG